MKKHLTVSEVESALKRMIVLIDTREQKNEHIIQYLDSKGIGFSIRRIRTGDYSAQLDDMTIEDEIVIERKGSLTELAGNVAGDRTRFEAELIRAKAVGVKVFLMVEDAEWSDISRHRYRTELSPKAFEATLMAWQARYNVTILFTPKEDAGRRLYEILWYWMRENITV